MSKKISNPPPTFPKPPPPPDPPRGTERLTEQLTVAAELPEELRAAAIKALRERDRVRWEYMTLCPDSAAGLPVLLQDVGDEGWEAVCSWVEQFWGQPINRILFKRLAV